jgi:hypothetical protein
MTRLPFELQSYYGTSLPSFIRKSQKSPVGAILDAIILQLVYTTGTGTTMTALGQTGTQTVGN